jgi:hypothetical protein
MGEGGLVVAACFIKKKVGKEKYVTPLVLKE